MTINSGDPAKFQSQAIGNPSPVISWYKDDHPLELDNRKKTFQEGNTYTLLILEGVAADSGCYECVAENDHGKVYTRAFLTVLGDKEIPQEDKIEIPSMDQFNLNNVRAIPLSSKFTQPAIQTQLRDQVVREGSSALFNCVILHSERKTIFLFFSNLQ